MTKKILCAVDGSKAADTAIDFAIEQAKRLDVPVSFLNVNLASERATSKTHYWDTTLLGAANLQTDRMLGKAAEKARGAGVDKFECVTAAGREIASAIVSFADINGFDHIVTGHSVAGLSKLGLGSVSAQVVAQAHCPVTVAR